MAAAAERTTPESFVDLAELEPIVAQLAAAHEAVEDIVRHFLARINNENDEPFTASDVGELVMWATWVEFYAHHIVKTTSKIAASLDDAHCVVRGGKNDSVARFTSSGEPYYDDVYQDGRWRRRL